MDRQINNTTNFGSATHVYFFTKEGRRIVSDKNVRTCTRYLVRQLNGAKNLKSRNTNLVDTFTYDAKQQVGDTDYRNLPKVRSVYEYINNKFTGYINIITGKDVKTVDKFGSEIGKAKHIAKERTGSTKSFETTYSIDKYNRNSTKLAQETGIYKDGKRQAFAVVFDPTFKKNGDHKGFEYVRSFYFDESKLG
ncbi:MAG: hypothetical protein ACI4S3_03950 [Candidatus Gastranaerophilaceae bacterium]